MKQLAAPWYPDLWAERWERTVKDEAFCYKWCEFVKICHIVGQPYSGRDCRLQEDERGSR